MSESSAAVLDLNISDVSGQKRFRASGVPVGSTIGELVDRLVVKMGLVRNDVAGNPLSYYLRGDREARLLDGSEIIGETLQDHDSLTLTPSIDAGGW